MTWSATEWVALEHLDLEQRDTLARARRTATSITSRSVMIGTTNTHPRHCYPSRVR